MPENAATERHPFISLLLLLLLIVIGSIVFSLLGLALAAAIYGTDDMMSVLSGDFSVNIGLAKIIQIATTIGMFIIPALLLARYESRNISSYLKLDFLPSLLLTILCIVIVYCTQPFLGWIIELNQEMKFPGVVREIEVWMREKEDLAAEVTIKFLVMENIPELIGTIILIAVFPAIGEELLFRGCLQHIFTRWTRNKHWGIWIAAILFSAIHLQFYGFIPRMLLGALFGYLLIWSNNLWIPILAHFVNNASAVFTAYQYQQNGISLDKLEESGQTNWLYTVLSFILTAALLWFFYRKSRRLKLIELTNGAGMD